MMRGCVDGEERGGGKEEGRVRRGRGKKWGGEGVGRREWREETKVEREVETGKFFCGARGDLMRERTWVYISKKCKLMFTPKN